MIFGSEDCLHIDLLSNQTEEACINDPFQAPETPPTPQLELTFA
jgi:hypothetical protein